MDPTTAPPPRRWRPPRWLALGLAALTVLAVAALALVPFLEDIEPREPFAADLGEADLEVAADGFDRPDAGTLADADHPWEEQSGRWAVQDGHAALVEPAPGEAPSLVVLPTGEPDGVLRATVTAVEPGWGVAFRVEDADNHLALVAGVESWALRRVVDGVATETADVLPVPPADLMRLEVRLAGSRIDVSIENGPSATVTEDALVDGDGIGLLATTGRNAASMAWDDVGLSRR